MELDGYSFRRYALEDWEQINELYFDEYGHDYPYPLHDHRSDLTALSTVAEKSGNIVGFARATPFEGHNDVYEFGGLIVAKPNRHKKIAHELTYSRMRAVLLRNPAIIMSEPVCYRADCASQHNLLKYGFACFGIRPFKYPSLQLHLLGEQAETVSLSIRHLNLSHGFEERPIFVPQEYVPFLKAVRLSIGKDKSAGVFSQQAMPPPIHNAAITAHGRTGSEFVHIPLNWKESLDTINEYRQKGYLFSGVLPDYGTLANGFHFDYLTLYRPPQHHGFDFDLINVLQDMKRLKSLMAHEYAATVHKRSDIQLSSECFGS